jgi:hypothetical protein
MQDVKSNMSLLRPLNIGNCFKNSLLMVRGCRAKGATDSQYTCTKHMSGEDGRLRTTHYRWYAEEGAKHAVAAADTVAAAGGGGQELQLSCRRLRAAI